MNILIEKFNEVLKKIEEVQSAGDKIESAKDEIRRNERIINDNSNYIFNTLTALDTLIDIPEYNEEFDPFKKTGINEMSREEYKEFIDRVTKKVEKYSLNEELKNMPVNKDKKEKKTKI